MEIIIKQTKDLKPHALNALIYGDNPDAELLDSIKAKGILTPLLITNQNVIISGHRRYWACLSLGIKELPCIISPIIDALEIEEQLIFANIQRPKNNEQIAREYSKLKEIEAEKAKRRMIEGRKSGGRGNKKPENSTPNLAQSLITSGESRTKAAETLGIGHTTAEKSVKIVETIDRLKMEGKAEEAKEIQIVLNKKSVNAAFTQIKPLLAEQKKEEEIKTELTKPISTAKFNITNENIDWARYTWNPVEGCKHGCPYCYARDIHDRFIKAQTGRAFDEPILREHLLAAPKNTPIPITGPTTVFVGSMSDLFGNFIPTEWINKVLEVVKQNSQWTYLFLTKNPMRYSEFHFPKNCWLGATIDKQERVAKTIDAMQAIKDNYEFNSDDDDDDIELFTNTFVSFEPLLEEIEVGTLFNHVNLIIIGSRSKTTSLPEFQPEWSWVEKLLFAARHSEHKIDVYFKPNLTVTPKEHPFFRNNTNAEKVKEDS